jgi:hypothetical protein
MSKFWLNFRVKSGLFHAFVIRKLKEYIYERQELQKT